MNFAEYQEAAQRTSNPDMTIWESLIMAQMGLSGESGEISDVIKKWRFHGHELDRAKLIEEAGDLMWYLAELCSALGVTMEKVAIANIEKLQRRYPEGFSSERSIHREVS